VTKLKSGNKKKENGQLTCFGFGKTRRCARTRTVNSLLKRIKDAITCDVSSVKRNSAGFVLMIGQLIKTISNAINTITRLKKRELKLTPLLKTRKRAEISLNMSGI